MKISDAFEGNYLKGADLEGREVHVAIDRVEVEELGQGKEKERKPVLYFQGHERGLVLNRINADTISSLYGEETDDWTGRELILYFDPAVMFGTRRVGGLRVKSPKQPAKSSFKPKGNAQITTGKTAPVYDELNPPPHDETDVRF